MTYEFVSNLIDELLLAKAKSVRADIETDNFGFGCPDRELAAFKFADLLRAKRSETIETILQSHRERYNAAVLASLPTVNLYFDEE